MEEQQLKDIVYSGKVLEFVAVANEYCRMVESARDYDAPALVNLARKLLPLLYFKGSLLPVLTPVLDEEPAKTVTELDYNVYLQRWMAKLGNYDAFREVFDPELQFGMEAVTASISESMLDIYQDMKDFVTSYSLGDEAVMHDALAVCLRHFGEFWGQRLVNVLRALHQLWFTEGDQGLQEGSAAESNNPATGTRGWVDRFFSEGNG